MSRKGSTDMKTETAIGAALTANGITANVVALRKALALFRNNGGTFAQASAELNAAYADDETKYSSAGRTLSERAQAARMGSGGQIDRAQDGPNVTADASRQDAAKGSSRGADKAKQSVPDASPRKMPGHARRGAAAIAGVQSTMAKSLFDTIRLPGDDRSIGDVTWKELQGLARKHAEAYRLLALLDGYCQPADPDAPVRDVVKEDTLREFVEIARLSNVH